MKVLTLHQPYATLIALGVKTIETRPQPFRSLVGQRIAIHAAARKPATDPPQGLRQVGDWWVEDERDGEFNIHRWTAAPCCDGGHQCIDEVQHPLPLGAIVCTAVVTDSLPMRSVSDRTTGPAIVVDAGDELLVRDGPRLLEGGVLAGQRPLGDFRPGRYGLLLAAVRRLAEPIPFRGGQGLSRSIDDALLGAAA